MAVERRRSRRGQVGTTTCFDAPDTSVFGLVATGGTRFADVLEGVASSSRYPLQARTRSRPPVRYWHLDVPADVSLGCNADRAHRSGVTGLGIRIAMVDTGSTAHPFFTERGYRVQPTVLGPGTVDPHIDSVGHGTGESANIFATAPDITLLPVKCANASAAWSTRPRPSAAVSAEPDDHLVQLVAQHPERPARAPRQALAAEVAAP